MATPQQLAKAQQDGFDRLRRYDTTTDPEDLRSAADIWRWVARETSDPGQRSFVLAAVSVAMRRYYYATEELWALRDAVASGRAAVQGETVFRWWLSACVYLGIATYTYFDATQERAYLDEALAVLRAARAVAADAHSRGEVLSHLGAALAVAWESLREETFLAEAVDIGREAVQLPGPLRPISAVDLIRNLRDLGGVRDDVGLLRESESVARWARRTRNDGMRGSALFELARTLDAVAEKVTDPAVRAEAVAVGEASVELARDPAEHQLRTVVIDDIRRRLRNSPPEPDPAP
ncbi:hypothetical protein ACIOD2_46950 [Amycolatopsis sp. NPDC088138]|uniref:hypothetical protein n=1 Tax=Amycolatopsis sp. NPDC088138 TaxID=3363938 RepID=UPI0037F943D6